MSDDLKDRLRTNPVVSVQAGRDNMEAADRLTELEAEVERLTQVNRNIILNAGRIQQERDAAQATIAAQANEIAQLKREP